MQIRLRTKAGVMLALGWVWAGSVARAAWVQDGGSLNVNVNAPAYGPDIAYTNGTPYVAWYEGNATLLLYVKHYNGANWVQDGGTLNINANQSAKFPSLSINNQTPYIAWTESNGSALQLYVKHYNGIGWQQDFGSLNINSAQSAEMPSLAMINGTPYAAWSESNGLADQVYVKHLTTGGWMQDGIGGLNVNVNKTGMTPAIAAAGATPFVAWSEQSGSIYQLYVKYFNGLAWVQAGGGLNINANENARMPQMKAGDATPYITWYEYSGGRAQIYVKRYNGMSFESLGGSLNVSAGQNAVYPAVAMYGITPYVGWNEYDTGTTCTQIYMKHFNGLNWTQDGGSLNVNACANASYPRNTIGADRLYAAWPENNGVADQIYVKHLQLPTFTPTQTPLFTVTPTMTLTQTVVPTATSTPTGNSTAVPAAPPSFTSTPAAANPARPDQAVAYPMPASRAVTFAFHSTEGGSMVEILVYNAHYRLVKKLTGTAVNGRGSLSWEVSGIAPGIYYYQVKVGAKKFQVNKLVIAR